MSKIKNDKKTFSEEIKKEIVSLNFENHCMKALLLGFIKSKLVIIIKTNEILWKLSSQFDFILNFISNVFMTLYDCKVKKSFLLKMKKRNKEMYFIEIKANFVQIESDLFLNDENWIDALCANRCCKRAYILGSFLACGSINPLNSKSYHLEIRNNSYNNLLDIQKLLISFNIFAVLAKYNSKTYILYIKKADQISDFLKLIGASSSMIEFENNKISKDFNMNITRLNNLDISNITKTTIANTKQIKQIKYIMKLAIWKIQKNKFKKFCLIRIKNETATLDELAKIMTTKYNITISKSGINHFVRYLNKMYEENFKK